MSILINPKIKLFRTKLEIHDKSKRQNIAIVWSISKTPLLFGKYLRYQCGSTDFVNLKLYGCSVHQLPQIHDRTSSIASLLSLL